MGGGKDSNSPGDLIPGGAEGSCGRPRSMASGGAVGWADSTLSDVKVGTSGK